MSDSDNPYPDVDPNLRFPELEERILKSWEADKTFQASVDQREGGDNEYVFYDGPPFANGLPHYGHLLTGYVKDVVPRYQSMRGRRVERRFGWDCHGLPAELEAEKDLGVSGRQEIEALGIDTFNQACEASVQKYTGEWRRYVTRQARWVDFDNDYKTMDTSYMESVMWAFKQLYDKGLVYEGFRVMPYSWAVETPLSNFEIRMDNSYRSRQDPAVTVSFELEPVDGDPATLSILIWTTTPWTLPSNLALAVGEDIDYAIMKGADGRHLVIGAATRGSYEKELEGYEEVGMLKGAALVDRRYKPIFPYFENHENAFRILAADFVDTGEGTGTVHMAPGFGEDDQAVCVANWISIVCPVDEKGRYTSEVEDWAGINVLEANKPIIKNLRDRGVLFRHVTYEHNYPHCWRTDEPLIYKAVSSWYVEVTKFRDRMVELNQQINWIPSHIRDGQFGKWLENARDWSISRNRYWGSPIPVWKSDDPAYPRTDVYGSIAELERDFGVEVPNLHRPFLNWWHSSERALRQSLTSCENLHFAPCRHPPKFSLESGSKSRHGLSLSIFLAFGCSFSGLLTGLSDAFSRSALAFSAFSRSSFSRLTFSAFLSFVLLSSPFPVAATSFSPLDWGWNCLTRLVMVLRKRVKYENGMLSQGSGFV